MDTFPFQGKVLLPKPQCRIWCVSQRVFEQDELFDDKILGWHEYCTADTNELFIELDGRDNDDGVFDSFFEIVVIFKSTCNPSQTGEYRLDFRGIDIQNQYVELLYEILLPNGIIRKSP